MQRVGERAHLRSLPLDERHDILAVGEQRRIGRPAKRYVQRRPILRVVDRVAAEHQLDPALHFGLLRQLEQRLERTRVEQLPAEVEQDAFGFERKPLEALRVRRE
jgi:hypothetical protein